MKEGYFKTGSKYRKCQLVAGPYAWRNAVRIRFSDGSETITSLDKFVAITPAQAARASRPTKAQQRNEMVKKILAALPPEGEATAYEIAKISGIDWPESKIRCWPELSTISRKFHHGKIHYSR